MRSFLRYIYFLFISLILGFSLSSFTKDYFIKPVDGFNQVSFDFGYLLDTQDITIKAYDENNEVKFDETKKLVKTYPNATLETPLIEALKYGVTLQNIGYLISINSSHKIEVTINGKGNIAIIHEVKCNRHSAVKIGYFYTCKSTSFFLRKHRYMFVHASPRASTTVC